MALRDSQGITETAMPVMATALTEAEMTAGAIPMLSVSRPNSTNTF
jgi:hypothetical protein